MEHDTAFSKGAPCNLQCGGAKISAWLRAGKGEGQGDPSLIPPSSKSCYLWPLQEQETDSAGSSVGLWYLCSPAEAMDPLHAQRKVQNVGLRVCEAL